MTMINPTPLTRRAVLRRAVGGVAGADERGCLDGARRHSGEIAVGRDLLEV
jgi:hypothetical protein